MTEKIRGFEVVSTYKEQDVQLPTRATKHSAGYDFYASKEIIVPSMIKQILSSFKNGETKAEQSSQKEDAITSVLVPTGVKAYMPAGEYLLLANRSSNPIKNQLALPNGVGIIDGDYYGNESNDGEIFFQLINYGLEDRVIQKGDRIGQGIFMPYMRADNEEEPLSSRMGGFGSSGR